MFPRGPRFEPEKISQVPGPNAYNPGQESQLEAYKRGAFLEKTDRFMKQNASEVPGPGALSTDTTKISSKSLMQGAKRPGPSPGSEDRYSALQRRVEELEKIHNEGKKAHHAEVERLKLELARTQKTNSELVDCTDKQKKRHNALELRVEELKKSALSDKAEIKDLAVKLRMSEHQRTQITAKQGEVADLKKTIQALESKRKEEARDKVKVITELEKSLAAEKKKREILEGQLKELRGKHDAENRGIRENVDALKAEIVTARDELGETQHRLEMAAEEAHTKEHTWKQQLEDHQLMLCIVAEQYGELAAAVVPKVSYEHLKHENAELQLRAARSARKIANSEAQVIELANLIRQSQDESRLLRACVQQLEKELHFYSDVFRDGHHTSCNLHLTESFIAEMDQDMQHLENQIMQTNLHTLELELQYYHLGHKELLDAYADAENELQEAQVISETHNAELADAVRARDSLSAQSQAAQKERDVAQELLAAATKTADDLKASSELLKQEVALIEARLNTEKQKAEAALKKEKDSVQRLTVTIQKARMAEDVLRVEIGQLTSELAEAERFQEAYYALSDEVESLIARNTLAEEEARSLSAFNAEILGHQNPAQRIMYVDRIRQELTETKYKLLASTKAHEVANTVNQDLQNELDMYKSVAVPHELKPRTNMTRLMRPPLVVMNQSFSSPTYEEQSKPSQTLDAMTGNMTLDEII